MTLVALVGVNIGEKRFEPGERITADVTERQRRWLLNDGYAEEVEKGQRLPVEHKEAIEAGAADPIPVEEQVDTKEE
jgi:hypothetical protein